MPGRNGTGPKGSGPMTGRRLGFCVSENQQKTDYTPLGYGRGLGRGFRSRHGWNNYSERDVRPYAREGNMIDEIKNLNEKINKLEKKLSEIEQKQ